MRTNRLALCVLFALTLAGVSDLAAQRRTTSGGSSGGSSAGTRQTPRGSGGSVGSGERRGGSTSSRPSATSSGRGTRSEPQASAGQERSRGRIAAIRNRANAARIRTSRGVTYVRGVWVGPCYWGCTYWGWYDGYWGWYHGGWWYPAYYPRYHRPPEDELEAYPPEERGGRGGQGYLDYPYAGGEDGEVFVRRRTTERRGFAAVSGQYFSDRGSSTQAGRFAIEGAYSLVRGQAEFNQYVEPVSGGEDRMRIYRVGIGVQPRLGSRGYLIAGAALRGIELDDGNDASGPEAELGVQLFPVRPLGVNLNGRVAALSWTGADEFTFRELNATGSFFMNRLELQGGWHWMRVGDTPAFAGPVVGVRIWF